ncbi:MAG TPA: AraC family transcriptional regulator [Spirochaetota bacterium]|nr:AraC family transcriptional regulator [Spirochaetota bacterium]
MNEKELFTVSDVSYLQYTMICFHPRMVNSELSYDSVVDANPDQSATIKMDRCSLRPFIERDERFTGYIQLGIESELRLKQFIINLERELRTQDTDLWPCRSRSTLFEILFLLGNTYRGGISVPHNSDVTDSMVQRIIRFFGNNYHKKITINEICTRFQTNRNTLSGTFYHETGKTVIEYLNDLRISIACMMLRDTELVIEEIGYRTGFNDPAHFRRTFRKKTGLTPALYRRTFFKK